ncbi:MAG: hypothetical protein C4293_07575, partial [Nitrospiraceae bacterium]
MRVEEVRNQIFDLVVTDYSSWGIGNGGTGANTPGYIHNVRFDNLIVDNFGVRNSNFIGYSPTQNVDGVYFNNFSVAGSLMTNASMARFNIGSYVSNMVFTNNPTSPPSQPSAPDLIVQKTSTPIVIDGQLTDWAGAGAATFTGANNTATGYALWDDQNLYIRLEVKDTQLNATFADANIWQDDTLELFLDTRHDRSTSMQEDDYHVLVNLNNVQLLLRGNNGTQSPASLTMTSAVSRQGTLNNNSDTDSGYTVELAIPWSQLGISPSSGMMFGIDLAVDDRDATGFDYFDYARIAPNAFAQPNLWKTIQLR